MNYLLKLFHLSHLNKIILPLSFISLVILIGCGEKTNSPGEFRQSAPPDAYEEDPNFAYYGCEGTWSMKMFSEKTADRQYKRLGQRLLLFVLDGEPENSIEECKNRLEKYPDDQEALFVLTIAYCAVNEIDNAWETAKSAMTNGLCIERFIAGPRDLLKPLYDHPEFKLEMDSKNIKLIHGPMMGSISDSNAKIWIRTAGEYEVILNLFSSNETVNPYQTLTGRTKSNDDYVFKFEIENLSGNKKYFYDLLVGGEKVISKNSFRTFHKNKDQIRLAFGGGAGFTPKHEKMWDTVNDRNPDALLLLGDNVYIDFPQMPGSFHDYTYYRRQSEPKFRSLISGVPVYSIWDDHDSGTNDVWLGPYIDKPDWKLPMLNHFKRQWINPSYGEENNPGCYYNFSIGKVDLFMLDCRFYRTNPFKDEKTMLGPKQKQWLKDSLLESDGIFKLLVSSVPWSPNAKPGSHDTWDGFPEEREEIFNYLAKNKIEGVVLISADRHRSDAWKIERENGYDLYEFESSKLTNIHTHKIMPGSLFGYNEKCSFGELNIDLSIEDPQLTYSIINIDGEMIDSISINSSVLKYPGN